MPRIYIHTHESVNVHINTNRETRIRHLPLRLVSGYISLYSVSHKILTICVKFSHNCCGSKWLFWKKSLKLLMRYSVDGLKTMIPLSTWPLTFYYQNIINQPLNLSECLCQIWVRSIEVLLRYHAWDRDSQMYVHRPDRWTACKQYAWDSGVFNYDQQF